MSKAQDEKIKKIEYYKKESKKEALQEILDFAREDDLPVKLTAIVALAYFNYAMEAKELLIMLTNHSNEEVRYNAIESLSEFAGEDVGEAILKKINDPDDLVRIFSVENLGYVKYKKAVPQLLEKLSDNDELVRGYAAGSLGIIGDRSVTPILEEKLMHEKRDVAKLRFYFGLYDLGVKKYFNKILDMLNCTSYQVRCAAVDGLVRISNKENLPLIKQRFKDVLKREDTIAVKSTIKEALKDLDEMYKN